MSAANVASPSERSERVKRLVRVEFPHDKLPVTLAATCPICGAGLLLTGVEACVQDDNGEWIADEVTLQCAKEPDTDSPDWEEWHAWHYRMPYVDWLPLEMRILKAVQKRFFFSP